MVRRLNVVSSTYASGVTTVVADATHYLVSGDLVTLRLPNNPCLLTDVAVTVVSATSFSVLTPMDYRLDEKAEVEIKYFRTGLTGGMPWITLANATGAPTVLQSWVSGSGGASYTVEGSLDKLHPTPDAGGTVTHAAADGDTQAVIIVPAWTWVRINIISVGAGTKLHVNVAS
jgi:hypothetical protein